MKNARFQVDNPHFDELKEIKARTKTRKGAEKSFRRIFREAGEAAGKSWQDVRKDIQGFYADLQRGRTTRIIISVPIYVIRFVRQFKQFLKEQTLAAKVRERRGNRFNRRHAFA
jgi:hypothetical protein